MRQDVVNALKNSKSAFVRELVGTDPVAVFRWAIVRASFRALFAFKQAGKTSRRAGKRAVFRFETGESLKFFLFPESLTHLNCEKPLPRRSSDSQLNSLTDEKKLPR